ncbi:MAG: AraC family transcriptional regulator [Nevskia sp.]|nr:AraC family transcriptional regulator [Nevskia sp.]
MAETLFAFDKRNYRDCQTAFRGTRNQEYYLGDYTIDPGSVIDVRAERKAVGTCSIIRLRSKTRLFFRRAWPHIQQDATDVAVLWFVKRGRLCVSHQRGHTVAQPGDFAITQSMTPFAIECLTDADSVHEVLHVIVPTHVLRRFLPYDLTPGFCMHAQGRDFAIAERLLSDLFEDTGELADHIAEALLDSSLLVLSEAIKCRGMDGPARLSLSEKRLQDVLRYIDVHVSDPKLSIATVAKGCGISPRYLSLLLKLHGTPFSTLVWDKRLAIARDWLTRSKPGEASISQIAYRVGFKSPAHFSRMFKRTFHVNPRRYRACGTSVAGPGPAGQAASGAESSH